jgi:endonuclease YncB( thermonuclease family)
MAYRLVKGQFFLFVDNGRRTGYQPDGDSVRFKPNNPQLLKNVGGRSAKLNPRGLVQLRFEGIDALEIHYKDSWQAPEHAEGARDYLLKDLLGFAQVEYTGNRNLTVKSAQPHPQPGYILTRNIDPYGRPVAFVFAGSPNGADGSEPWLKLPLLNRSANAKLMGAGLLYPAYYTGLPTDLRDRLTELATQAYNGNRGLWPDDRTLKGVQVRTGADLKRLAIWPKLFRRLTEYFDGGASGLAKFDQWLRADRTRDDALWIVPRAEQANLHDVVAVSGQTVKMRYCPEELIIVPR